jgi:hypothetical protein
MKAPELEMNNVTIVTNRSPKMHKNTKTIPERRTAKYNH